MPETLLLNTIDHLLKPQEWYQYSGLTIQGFQIIGSKEDQKYAGLLDKPVHDVPKRNFGFNPVKPYRDYYGNFKLTTKLITGEIPVKFAIGYTIHSRIVTSDDYSNFGWLRLATGIDDYLYPNLSHQKQLLEYFLAHSKKPKFIITRVYHYLQFELYQELTKSVLKQVTEYGKTT